MSATATNAANEMTYTILGRHDCPIVRRRLTAMGVAHVYIDEYAPAAYRGYTEWDGVSSLAGRAVWWKNTRVHGAGKLFV